MYSDKDFCSIISSEKESKNGPRNIYEDNGLCSDSN